MWRHMWRLFVRQYRAKGTVDAFRMLFSAMRAVAHRQALDRLFQQDVFARYVASDREADALSHVSHRYFLSAGLSSGQRINCALSHFSYEGRHYTNAYHAAVYGGRGLELWSREVDAVRYSMWLRSPRELRHEGPVSVVLLADDVWLHETSFAWVDTSLFGSPDNQGPVMFLTRNQSVRFDAPALIAFRNAFPQNSPPYFCLAAAHGIAKLHGQTRIAGIKHRCQIAFEEKYAKSFQSSYCDFWRSFGGVELDQHAFMMPVPVHVPPLSEVKPKHRSRARKRRLHWERITQAALDALAPHRRPMGK